MVENPGEVGYNVKDMSRHRGKEDEKNKFIPSGRMRNCAAHGRLQFQRDGGRCKYIGTEENGEIVHTIVEDFGESYYDLDELKSSTEEMIADYNSSAGADRVKLNSAQTQDGVVRLVMTFKSSEDYSGFYRQALFSGTVKEAFGAGYDLDVTLNSVKEEGTTISKQDILDMGDKHVAIVRENINIRPYGDILYMSSDVTLGADGKTAVVTNGESLSYIIFK